MLAALFPILPATAPEPSDAGMKIDADDPTAPMAPLSEPGLRKKLFDAPTEKSALFTPDCAAIKFGKSKLAAFEFKEAAPPSPIFPGIKEL